MRIIFAGTPEIAVPSLAILEASSHEVIMVLTQPDRPAGRGRKLAVSPVKEFAQNHDIAVGQMPTLKTASSVETIRAQRPDLIVVLAYGLLLPKNILEIPTFGCINLHMSLLPQWRGAAPIQQAILCGDKMTGVTMMQMDSGLDTGDMLKQSSIDIMPHETTQTLQHRLGKLAAEVLADNLNNIAEGNLSATLQDEENASYAKKIEKADACLAWGKSNMQLDRTIRAFNPWPIAFTELNGSRLRIWQAELLNESHNAPHGMIINANKNGLDVACGVGCLRLQQLQWPGGKVQNVETLLNANNNPLQVGVILGQSDTK